MPPAIPNSNAALHAHNSLLPYANARLMEKNGPLTIVSGDGIYVTDEAGERYLDGVAGLWSVAVGFNEQRLVEAAYAQMKKLPFYHSFAGRSHDTSAQLAAKLLDMVPMPMSRVHFVNSGSEANDTVIKLVRYFNHAQGRPQKNIIVSRQKAYHGSTVGSGSLTGLPFAYTDFGMPIENICFTSCPSYWRYGQEGESEEAFAQRCADELEALIIEQGGADRVAAFIGEPVMGAGGVILPPAEYWERISAVCRKYDMLLIADEVICGFGRTGTDFACRKYNIEPDMLVLSKQLTSSYMPMAALLVNDKVFQVTADNSERLGIFGNGITASGHPVACAVALENIRILEEDGLMARVPDLEPLFLKRLHALEAYPQVGEARGVGLIGAIELVSDPVSKAGFTPPNSQGVALHNLCMEEGLLLRGVGEGIAFSPPLIITEAQINDMFDRTEVALKRQAQNLDMA